MSKIDVATTRLSRRCGAIAPATDRDALRALEQLGPSVYEPTPEKKRDAAAVLDRIAVRRGETAEALAEVLDALGVRSGAADALAVRQARATAVAAAPQPEAAWPIAHCRTCSAEIIWTVTARQGKPMPVDAGPVPDGNVRLTARPGQRPLAELLPVDERSGVSGLRKSHFATCGQAGTWRRRSP
ncbi:hypothetical protein [Catenuloplanes atrovinosus]|uniref:Uncharacterized protein n=1 Tax=Catenuloplanes atrovinosus TaxID=137266 RepID=A0AAE3YUI6_9ACTN|nr:hypothetical protein [Catenuloplanes atrovinosus]MDR7278911.1 hypothetical protein [Catenuloplanes atrovinosus]